MDVILNWTAVIISNNFSRGKLRPNVDDLTANFEAPTRRS